MRPRRPLPPRNGWMDSNWAWTIAHWTRSGSRPRSAMKRSSWPQPGKHLRRRRRYVRGVGERRPGRPDPVLRRPELARRPSRRPARRANRRSCRPRIRSRSSGCVTRDSTPYMRVASALPHAVELDEPGAGGRRGDLAEQQLRERQVGAFDARAEQRLLAQERRCQRRRVGQLAAQPRERSQGGVGARQGDGPAPWERSVGAAAAPGRRRYSPRHGDHPSRLLRLEVPGVHRVVPAPSALRRP